MYQQIVSLFEAPGGGGGSLDPQLGPHSIAGVSPLARMAFSQPAAISAA